MRFIFIISLLVLLLSITSSHVGAGSPPSKGEEPAFYEGLLEKAKEGKKGKLGTHYYWDNGLNIVGPKKNLRLKINGHMGVDAGYIDASGDIEEAFSGTDGLAPDFRRLQASVFGTLFDAVAFKFDMDFANIRTIKDVWFCYTRSPFLSHFKLGHVKEPFSLERLISAKNITFMERALPTDALTLGRNIGIRYDNVVVNERMTLAAGFFLNTAS